MCLEAEWAEWPDLSQGIGTGRGSPRKAEYGILVTMFTVFRISFVSRLISASHNVIMN